jgi:uncharacterized membrane protein YhaH (DUF805 family)
LLDYLLDFEGRLGRLEYIKRFLIISVITASAAGLSYLGSITMHPTIFLYGSIVSLAFLAFSTASLHVRRLHDMGLCSANLAWIIAVELFRVLATGTYVGIGLAVLDVAIGVWLMAYPGNAGSNRYGPPPGNRT